MAKAVEAPHHTDLKWREPSVYKMMHSGRGRPSAYSAHMIAYRKHLELMLEHEDTLPVRAAITTRIPASWAPVCTETVWTLQGYNVIDCLAVQPLTRGSTPTLYNVELRTPILGWTMGHFPPKLDGTHDYHKLAHYVIRVAARQHWYATRAQEAADFKEYAELEAREAAHLQATNKQPARMGAC